MRERSRIVDNLESLYREAFRRAEEAGDREAMSRLDFEFQRDQIHLEVLLDLRDLLSVQPAPSQEEAASLLDKAAALPRPPPLR